MVRRVLLIFALVASSSVSATECITFTPSAREFLTAATDAARAVAHGPDTLRVVATLFGSKARKDDIIRVDSGQCHQVKAGAEYFMATRCPAGSECYWMWTEVASMKGFEQFARDRHTVTRPELMEKLRTWQKRKLSTEQLQRWLATADARDGDGPGGSLAYAVIERIEDLLAFSVQAEACNPGDATWLREEGSALYLERFARLPKQNTHHEYEVWLNEQDDVVKDEWEPERLEADLERSLESARSWDHTIDCFLRTYRDAPR